MHSLRYHVEETLYMGVWCQVAMVDRNLKLPKEYQISVRQPEGPVCARLPGAKRTSRVSSARCSAHGAIQYQLETACLVLAIYSYNVR
jgi:hypothetical protein